MNRRAALIISPVDPVDRCTALCRSHRRLKHHAAPRLPRGASASEVSDLWFDIMFGEPWVILPPLAPGLVPIWSAWKGIHQLEGSTVDMAAVEEPSAGALGISAYATLRRRFRVRCEPGVMPDMDAALPCSSVSKSHHPKANFRETITATGGDKQAGVVHMVLGASAHLIYAKPSQLS
ncbi:unnamed protein product [Pleuronectes platessa]|uniref:Uncharacterized protein n=1 Tax=Pleuronectes platessa TaxID=8262 RepID=A0A9N7UM84_PLEPL|nr:unnamed protein product [Pleuronectes platessa]